MGDTLCIDSDIPMPLPKGKSPYWEAVRKLEVGQSVLLPLLPESANVIGYRVWGKGNYRIDKEGNGTRVWRAA